MDRFDRIYELHKILSGARVPVSGADLDRRLECTRATRNRIIEHMRDHLNAPIAYDREHNGYHYDTRAETGAMFELPGIWFNASELQALLSMRELLRRVQPGLLDEQLAPIHAHIDKLLADPRLGGSDLPKRIRILSMAARAPGPHFAIIASALAERRRLDITYSKRADDSTSQRRVSPQRLTHYRDNWYLDAWCHLRNGLRTFALEQILAAQPTHEATKDLDETALNRHFRDSYGIFAGPAQHTAELIFSAARARWISREQWHPEQQGETLPDGRYRLRLPYADPTELFLDLMRYGADVEVIAPPELRQAIAQRLRAAAAQYPAPTNS